MALIDFIHRIISARNPIQNGIQHPLNVRSNIKPVVTAVAKVSRQLPAFAVGTLAGNQGFIEGAGKTIGGAGRYIEQHLITSPSNIGSTLKKVAIGTGIGAAGLTLAHYATSGKMTFPSARELAFMGGIRLNPVTGTIGALSGLSDNQDVQNFFARAGISTQSVYDKITGAGKSALQTSSAVAGNGLQNVEDYYTGLIEHLPAGYGGNTTINLTSPNGLGQPITVGAPSVNPSIEVGGSSGTMDAILLALLAAGGLGVGAGYLLGHHKKKRKYKKRRKHRR